MKHSRLSNLVVMALLSLIAASTSAAPVNIYASDKLMLGCGYADTVYEYIYTVMNEKAAHQRAFLGKQGESGRRLYVYGDGSWFLTFEYFHKDDVQLDISCIVAKGDENTVATVQSFRAANLPTADIGKPVARPALQ